MLIQSIFFTKFSEKNIRITRRELYVIMGVGRSAFKSVSQSLLQERK